MHIIKHILIYLLVLNTLASTLAVPLIYMDFGMRQDYIAEVLCINRDKPMLNCDGKCYLAKKLQAAQEQQEQENETINIKSAPVFFAQIQEAIAFDKHIGLLQNTYQVLPGILNYTAYLQQIFTPPRG
ncbi:hypothetical protein SAMN04488028_109112 [Reichenbachiella agariperforans]|uniref:Uncharacterized protein n=1 Tax=Reichenbachiella agariperforans TaxID=156994 RepID=A0A1M6VMH2_REIAG|nr:hypothetical protein [Reichenbachiella agariperforans]SHK82700.1 hypothetical protein SAMN04488028_109112 [Reichenbachiella agariperforans]